jgi:RNA polymerase sigma factor (sigma-70 family)
MLATGAVLQNSTIRQNSMVLALTPVHQFSQRERSPLDTLRRFHGDDVSLQTARTAADFIPSSSAPTATTRRPVESDWSVKIKNRNASRMIRPRSLTSSPRITESLSIKKGLSQPPSDSLLTREDEKELTNSLRKLRAAVRIRDELVLSMASSGQGRRPTEQEWAEACKLSVMELRRVMHEGREARSKLVSANTGLVTSIAKRHYYSLKQATEAGGGVGTILTLQDMVQEGNLGLMEAAERFEPERGFKFSTYATFWIRQRVMRAISECSRTIRLPAHGELNALPYNPSYYTYRRRSHRFRLFPLVRCSTYNANQNQQSAQTIPARDW